MREQDGRQFSTKQHRSRKTGAADQKNGKQTPAAQRPANDDTKAWKAYWNERGQPWRTEPEIDTERQKYLEARRSIAPDISQGIYPFKDVKLSRADIEWLLATHENGKGPVDWNDENQRKRNGLDLRGAILTGVNLNGLPLSCMLGGSFENTTTLDQRTIAAIDLERATLRGTHLEGAKLINARLAGAFLPESRLEQAYLEHIHLEGVNLRGAHLESADLRNAFFDSATNLNGTFFSNANDESARLAGLHWGDVDLSLVDWSLVRRLGDEKRARQQERPDGKSKNRNERLREYTQAVRANRQLAVALQGQGLNEDAARFAYRAQKLQGVVFRRQRKFGQYLFSGFLNLLAGYGYRPGRSVLWYLIIILGFAFAYHVLGGLSLFPPDAVIFSIMSFHGRGFFPSLSSETNLHNPLVMLAAAEAIVGLLIEISFIATFTQRFFGR